MNPQKKLVKELFDRGILVSENILNKELDQNLLTRIESETDLLVLNEDYMEIIDQSEQLVDWYEVDTFRVDVEKKRDNELYQTELQSLKNTTLSVETPKTTPLSLEKELSSIKVEINTDKKSSEFTTQNNVKEEIKPEDLISIKSEENKLESPSSSVTVVVSFDNVPHKYTVKDFTNIFISRYKFLEAILRNRQELQNTLAINRVLGKKEKGKVSIIGLIEEIRETKNNNIILTLEDMTGKIKVLISKNNKELYPKAKDLVVDEIIGISGNNSDKIIFADNIVWPDVPNNNEFKKSEEEEYAIFLSDIHVGSNLFLKDEFNKFLKWICSDAGNEKQREIAAKVKYIFVAGDLVDGVGIYPSQEEELEIDDIKEQYVEFVKLIKEIPKDKQIIMCPGNHDVVHLAEPQTAFYKDYSPELFELPNVTLVTNPSLINIGKTETFSGFNVLMYHGYSFDYYVANVESIRVGGGYNRSDLIMKFLLQRRHLAPAFKSTPYFPSHKEDPLLIKTIPDFFLTGHIHYSCVANYKSITMISGSCWQAKTSFQEKLGHEPEPARVPIVNLKTREIKILRFG